MTKYPFDFVPLPDGRSNKKPRSNGRTMIIDWSLDLDRIRGMLRLVGPYVDIVKVPIGLARLYEEELLREKFALYRANDIRTFVGGGFAEHIFAIEGEKALGRYFEEARRVGFDILEISDNYIPLNREERQRQIRMARDCGLTVFGEVGSKHERTDADTLIRQAEDCFEAGAEAVLLEGAEFIENGKINRALLDGVRAGLDMSSVLIEVPGPWISGVSLSMVQDLAKLLIKEVGPDVNLGNIMPDEALHIEGLRVGLGVVQPTVRLVSSPPVDRS